MESKGHHHLDLDFPWGILAPILDLALWGIYLCLYRYLQIDLTSSFQIPKDRKFHRHRCLVHLVGNLRY